MQPKELLSHPLPKLDQFLYGCISLLYISRHQTDLYLLGRSSEIEADATKIKPHENPRSVEPHITIGIVPAVAATILIRELTSPFS